MADTPPTQTMATVPVWALAYVMNHANFQDEGPVPEGWSSPKMQAACDALEAALSAIPDEVRYAD
jgi:hypothetical protein